MNIQSVRQSARYYTSPPDLPPYMYKDYTVSSVSQLIQWAKHEYYTALQRYSTRGEYATVKMLSQNYSPMRLLAEMNGFRKIVSILVKDSRIFNRLVWRDRIFIRRAYEIYEKLGAMTQD